MALGPEIVPKLRMVNPVDSWEKAIDKFLASGKYHRDWNDQNTISFTSTEVRKFVRKKLPRRNDAINTKLQSRYLATGWKHVLTSGDYFYFTMALSE